MMNFLAIGGWGWGVGSGRGEWQGNPHSPLFLFPCFSQFDDRRVFDVSDRAVVFAEQSQVDHDQFMAVAFIKIYHSPAQHSRSPSRAIA